MKMEIRGDTLHISSVPRLGEANARSFRDWVVAQLGDASRNVAVDLSQTTFIDSSGLGALVALHKAAAKRAGNFCLLNPQPSIQQILELTRLDSFFQIVNHRDDLQA
jgi:anti-sigma B factor antagonist